MKKEKQYLKNYILGVIAIVVLNTAFGAFYVLTKLKRYQLIELDITELVLCALNGVFLLLMSCMMLNAVNTIKRITYQNVRNPNNLTITLHLVMVFSAFVGMAALWTLFCFAKLRDANGTNEAKLSGRKLRTIGILIGNVGWFISFTTLLYMFWGFGIGINSL